MTFLGLAKNQKQEICKYLFTRRFIYMGKKWHGILVSLETGKIAYNIIT